MSKTKVKEKEVQEGYTINELLVVNQLLAKCTNDKEIKNSTTVLSGVRISMAVNKITKDFYAERDELFKAFNVEKVSKEDGQEYYDFENHEEKEKIEDALKKAAETKYEVKDFNKIDEDDFVFYTRGLSHNEIAFLYEFLVKK